MPGTVEKVFRRCEWEIRKGGAGKEEILERETYLKQRNERDAGNSDGKEKKGEG